MLPARVPFKPRRIEFKAFDTCRDIAPYRSLLALLQGIVLDEAFPGRALTPDVADRQRSAQLPLMTRMFRAKARSRFVGSGSLI